MNEEAMTPDKEQVVEPLTTEEIEDIRVRGTNLALVDPRFYSLWDVINRLLATLDAARTASVAGLDRESPFAASIEYPGIDERFDGRYRAGHRAGWIEARTAFGPRGSAPSIEQEPGEADWRGVVREAIRRYRLPNLDDQGVANLVIGALEGHGFVAREQEPGETLRAAAQRFLAAEEAYQHSDQYDADDGLLADELRDARAELRAALEANQYSDGFVEGSRFHRAYLAALEADRNPTGDGAMNADAVYDILVREAGAYDTESYRAQFASWYQRRDILFEFRFMGRLGFGGKLWWDSRRGFSVSCYPEDETPERLATIRSVNAALGNPQ